MVSREAFNVIAEELSYTFSNEYGESFCGIVVHNVDLTEELLFVDSEKKIVVNYTEWVERYPYLGLEEYKSFIEEKIRKEILDTNKVKK